MVFTYENAWKMLLAEMYIRKSDVERLAKMFGDKNSGVYDEDDEDRYWHIGVELHSFIKKAEDMEKLING